MQPVDKTRRCWPLHAPQQASEAQASQKLRKDLNLQFRKKGIISNIPQT